MSARTEAHVLVHGLLLAALAIDGATSNNVIPSNDKGPRPTGPYLTITIQAINPIATVSDRRAVDLAGDVQLTGARLSDIRVSLQAFGEVAIEWLEALPLRLGWPSVLAVAAAREISPARNLTEFLDTGFASRAECEIGLYASIVDSRSATLVPAATLRVDGYGGTHIIPVEQ